MSDWQRQEGEPNLWYSRFERFRLMGPTRSLLAVYEHYLAQKGAKRRNGGGIPGAWRRAVERWRWIERAEAWDQSEREKREAEWQERQRVIREQDYQQGDRLRDLAIRILDEGPKFIKATRRLVKGEGGQIDREIVTLALNGDLAVKAIEAASKLQRVAAEMAPPKQAVEVTDKDGKPLFPLADLVALLRQADQALNDGSK